MRERKERRLRLIKCDMCGCIGNKDNEIFDQVTMSYVKSGYIFDTYEICEDCVEDLKKILTAGVDEHKFHYPDDPEEDKKE